MTTQRELPVSSGYAAAWRDDGSESGIVRTEQKRGDLVQMPFVIGSVTLSATGTATATLTNQPLPYLNLDGSGTYIRLTVSASATLANSATAKFWITGNVFGLRYLRSAATPIGCMIDGVAYTITAANNADPVTNASVSNLYGAVDYDLIADDLGPGRHFVELVFPAFLSGSQRVYNIFGYVADGNAGYQKPSGQVVTLYQATLALTATTGGTAQNLTLPNGIRGWRKALFCNTTAGAITVYCVYSTATSVVMWSKPVPAYDTVEFNPEGIIVDSSNIKFYVSGAGINMTNIWAM